MSSSSAAWYNEHRQLSIQMTMLSKECAKHQSKISEQRQQPSSNSAQSSQRPTMRTNHRPSKKISSKFQSTREIAIRIDRLRKHCDDAKTELGRLAQLERDPQQQSQHKIRNRCKIEIETYENEYDLLKEKLSRESTILDEQRIMLEKAIVESVGCTDDFLFND